MNDSCFIDIHCHLDEYEDIEKVVKNSIDSDVNIMIAQGTHLVSNRKVLDLAKKYPQIKVALGIYPIETLKLSDKEIENEFDFIRENKKNICAIGEVGIDFKESTDKNEHEKQKKVFENFVKLSIELDKPIIIHSRKAELECIEILEKLNAKKVIMHCFCGNFKLVNRIIQNKWFITIPSSVKRSEHFQKIIKEVDIKQLFCETDSPFLHPDKEWPNEPKNVIESYKKIAELKAISLDETKNKIFDNYEKLFK